MTEVLDTEYDFQKEIALYEPGSDEYDDLVNQLRDSGKKDDGTFSGYTTDKSQASKQTGYVYKDGSAGRIVLQGGRRKRRKHTRKRKQKKSRKQRKQRKSRKRRSSRRGRRN